MLVSRKRFHILSEGRSASMDTASTIASRIFCVSITADRFRAFLIQLLAYICASPGPSTPIADLTPVRDNPFVSIFIKVLS